MATTIIIFTPLLLSFVCFFISLYSKEKVSRLLAFIALFLFSFALGIYFYAVLSGGIYERFCQIVGSC